MSQVIRKYKESGKIEQSKPETFERSGVGKYNKTDLVSGLYKNIDTYGKNNNLSGDKMNSFREASNQFIKGIESGTITMNGDGTFTDSTGTMSSSGTFDKKWTGRSKDNSNNAFNLVGDYAKDYISQMQQHTDPVPTPKSRFNSGDYIEKEISKRWYGGNKVDLNNFFKNRSEQERTALMGEIANTADFNKIFGEYDWTDSGVDSAETLGNRLKGFGTAITSGKIDNDDYNSFAALGGSNLDKYLKAAPPESTVSSKPIEGQIGNIDAEWNNPDYDRTVDESGKRRIYKKGTNQEISGVLPGNPLEGTGNKYAFDGDIYDDTNLPEQYKQDISRARQAQLNDYTKLSDNNPFTKMLKGKGYNYITNLSQYASGIGNSILYGAYSDPSNTTGETSFYLKDPTTGKANNGSVEFNKTLREYQFVSNNGNVINLGAYNAGGTRSNQGTSFVNYDDTSENNRDTLFSAWMRNSEISNPASSAYKMVQNTLSKWIASGKSPFASYKGQYQWKSGDDVMNVRKGSNGQWQWNFNSSSSDNSSSGDNQLEELLRIPPAQRDRATNDKIMELQGYKKDGGIITAQLGTKFTRVDDAPNLQRPKISEEQAKKNQAANQSFTGRSNVSLGNNKDITDAGGVIKSSDKVLLGAAIADLASVGLGFVPGANIAATGIGVGASLAEFGADWASDGLDWGDAGRLGMNLGMDALSLIPAGKALKATKALGKIKKSIPLIMTMLNASNMLDPTLRAEYSKTLAKLVKGDIPSLNTGDFKNISAIGSLVLMGKNIAKSRQGSWNSSTVPSGKRKVTAMINGKQQTLEVDDAFFKNTKGKNQVSELKTKFAEVYNKNNKLEGDNAITSDKVAVDTKYFGQRAQSEKVSTRGDGNWLSNTFIGKHMLGYKDPSVIRGNENIPFSDAWFLKGNKSTGKPVNRTPDATPTPTPSVAESNRQLLLPTTVSRTQTPSAPIITPPPGNYRSVPVGTDITNPNKLTKPTSRTDTEITAILKPFIAPTPAAAIVKANTVTPKQRLDQFIEGNIPGGRQFGRQRAKTEREYADTFHPVAEKEQNDIWDNLIKGDKGFGYQDVTPKKSIYTPPTGTEITHTPKPVQEVPTRYAHELYNKAKKSVGHNKPDELPKKTKKEAPKTKHRRNKGYVNKKDEGGLLIPKGQQGLLGGVTNLFGTPSRFQNDLAINMATGKPSFMRMGQATLTKKAEQNPLSMEAIAATQPVKDQASAVIGAAKKPSIFGNVSVNREDVLALGRMAGGLATNNRAAKLYTKGLKPTLLDTFENTVPLQGNFQAKAMAEQQAGDLESMAARPRTSDASLQLAGELEASSRAGQARTQGGLQDAEKFYQTRMLGQQESDAAKGRRVEVANRNRASMNQISAAKNQIEAGRLTANYQQVLAPWMAGIENQYAQKRAMGRQLGLEEAQRSAERTYSPQFDRIKRDEIAAKANYMNADKKNTESGWYASDGFQGFDKRYKETNSAMSEQLFNDRKGLMRSSYMFGINPNNDSGISYRAAGGKLSAADKEKLQSAKDFNKRLLEDNKQFHKDIMESKREHNKLLASMSSLTSELIKKAMS